MPRLIAIISILREAIGKAMLNKKCLGAALLAAAAVSTTAMADDRGVNTAVGAVLGAAIGHGAGGRNGAIVGGVLGAAVGNSLSTRDQYYRGNRGGYAYYDAPAYVESRPAYVESRPVYVESEPVYYEAPRPVYYDAPRYYQQPAVIIETGRGYYGGGHYEHWNRGHGWGHHGR
jgi:hypothetical protein